MSIIARIFYSILCFAFGYIIIRYRKQVKSWSGGGFVWAEQYIGRGGTYLVLLLLGCGAIVFGVLLLLGTVDFLFQTTTPSEIQK